MMCGVTPMRAITGKQCWRCGVIRELAYRAMLCWLMPRSHKGRCLLGIAMTRDLVVLCSVGRDGAGLLQTQRLPSGAAVAR